MKVESLLIHTCPLATCSELEHRQEWPLKQMMREGETFALQMQKLLQCPAEWETSAFQKEMAFLPVPAEG